MTVPDTTAVGASIFKDVDVALAVVESVESSHTVGVGTPTGIGFWSMEVFYSPEEPGNNTELTEST